jgi:phage tail-like protein
MPLSYSDMLGLTNRFHVVIDGVDLGGWKSCKGLNVNFKHEEIWSGGHYSSPTILPHQVEYTAVTLQRAMNSEDSVKLRRWLSKVIVEDWYGGYDDRVGATACITVFDAHYAEVGSYSLRNVFPSSYKGPDLDAGQSQVATETLELKHGGFL